MITCPKTFVGVHVYYKIKNDISNMFYDHVIEELDFEKVSQKESN